MALETSASTTSFLRRQPDEENVGDLERDLFFNFGRHWLSDTA
jgi:hypothetical protein